jgi:hypothetical protein
MLSFLALLPSLVLVSVVLGKPIDTRGFSYFSPAHSAQLSRDLYGSLKDAFGYGSQRPQQQAIAVAEIDAITAAKDETPLRRRAAAACKIADSVFPGRVFTANNPEYRKEQDFNWYFI